MNILGTSCHAMHGSALPGLAMRGSASRGLDWQGNRYFNAGICPARRSRAA